MEEFSTFLPVKLFNFRKNLNECIPFLFSEKSRTKLTFAVDRLKLGADWGSGGRGLGHRVLQP